MAATRGKPPGSKPPKPINLALQGGGSHGALTWGVLDRLLEDERLAIRAISGTSAGAMNAVTLADGYRRGGREGAREALGRFWKAVGESVRFSPIRRSACGLRDRQLQPRHVAGISVFREPEPDVLAL